MPHSLSRDIRDSLHAGRLNAALATIDRVFAKENQELQGPIFVVGLPRSGTTLAYQLLSSHLDVGFLTKIFDVTYPLPNLTMRVLAGHLQPPRAFESDLGRVTGLLVPAEHSRIWYRWLPPDPDLGHGRQSVNGHVGHDLRATIASLSSIVGKPMMFKNLYLGLQLELLAELLPESVFVNITRDPLMVCQSILEGRSRQRRPEDWWSIRIPGYRSLAQLPIWRQVAIQVRTVTESLQTAGIALGDERYFELSYELLCQNPRFYLDKVSDWVRPIGIRKQRALDIPTSFSYRDEPDLDSSVLALLSEELNNRS